MAQAVNGHWTNDSLRAFLFRISFDFVTQLERMMDAGGVKPSELAKRLGVSKGRVSQILNNPGNLTLKTIVEWARALDLKVAIVAYDDGDVDNDNGPVNPQIFTTCWEKAGKPTDFFSAGMAVASTSGVDINTRWAQREMRDEGMSEVALTKEIAETLAGAHPNVWQPTGDQGVEQHAGTGSD
jgi:transcriptional regulator with XRE-family HTH domain